MGKIVQKLENHLSKLTKQSANQQLQLRKQTTAAKICIQDIQPKMLCENSI